MNKKIITLSLSLVLIIIIIFITIFILNNKKKQILDVDESLNRATEYLKDKINNEPEHYMKSIAYGDLKMCGNCQNGSRGDSVYIFFITKAIKEKLNEQEKKILLKRIKPNNYSLWGYHGISIKKEWNDADDTAFVMRALEMLNIGYKLNDIKYFYNKTNKTFSSFVQNDTMKDFVKNFESHPEVNANIYGLLNETTKDNNIEINNEFIRRNQNKDGSFKSFFYPSKYYSTYMFLNFLCNYKDIDNDLIDIKNKGVNFILNTQNKNGSWGKNKGNNYETALALESLKVCNIDNTQTEKAKKILLEKQNEDGSWDSNEIFWTFHLTEETYWNTYINPILTTSIVISAIK